MPQPSMNRRIRPPDVGNSMPEGCSLDPVVESRLCSRSDHSDGAPSSSAAPHEQTRRARSHHAQRQAGQAQVPASVRVRRDRRAEWRRDRSGSRQPRRPTTHGRASSRRKLRNRPGPARSRSMPLVAAVHGSVVSGRPTRCLHFSDRQIVVPPVSPTPSLPSPCSNLRNAVKAMRHRCGK